MESFRIGEFAKLNGISVQLLKNYDEQGILPPYWRDETGRHYVDMQSITLMEQHFLNEAGLSLRQARDLQEKGSLDDWAESLAEASSSVKKKIAEMRSLQSFLDEMRAALSAIQRKESWHIEPWAGKFMPKEDAYQLSWKSNTGVPSAFWEKITLPENMDPALTQCQWGVVLPPEFPYEPKPYNVIPMGPCFVYAHTIPRVEEHDSRRLADKAVDFTEPLRILAENGLKHRGVFFQRWICTTHEEDGLYVQALTRIPLRE